MVERFDKNRCGVDQDGAMRLGRQSGEPCAKDIMPPSPTLSPCPFSAAERALIRKEFGPRFGQ